MVSRYIVYGIIGSNFLIPNHKDSLMEATVVNKVCQPNFSSIIVSLSDIQCIYF